MMQDHPTVPLATGRFDLSPEDDGLCLYVAYADKPPEVHPLPADGVVTLGRSGEIQLADPTISRQHATLLVRPPPLLYTNHSKNGSRIGKKKLAAGESEALYLAQQIRLSPTTHAWVQRCSAPLKPWQVYKHAAFLDRLRAVCARQRDSEPFAVVRLLCEHVADEPVQQVLAQETIATDVAATYAPPREYELLLLHATRDEAAERAECIAERLRAFDAEVRYGIACWPGDGHSAEELLAQASGALRLQNAGQDQSHVSRTGEMGRLDERINQLAVASMLGVLLVGETGVGKCIFAQRLHQRSPRARGPFVTLNIASLPEPLLEAELFGSERGEGGDPGGNELGAPRQRGVFAQADGGTLFLDEVGDLPVRVQGRLLAMLDQIGGPGGGHGGGQSGERPLDVRLVSATHRDLHAEMEIGHFRRDLYYRLADTTLRIPPLRERTDEIEPLAYRFLAEACREAGMPLQPAISREALETLKRYPWEGNVRQLRSVMATAVHLCTAGLIRVDDLEIEDPLSRPRRAARIPDGTDDSEVESGEVSELHAKVEEVQKSEVLAAIQRCQGNQSAAAEYLQISRGTLIKLLKKYGYWTPRHHRRPSGSRYE